MIIFYTNWYECPKDSIRETKYKFFRASPEKSGQVVAIFYKDENDVQMRLVL